MTGNPDWMARFPALDRLPPDVRGQLLREASTVALPAGAAVYHSGQSPKHFLLVAEGVVRVSQVSEGGREIVLYRVSPGESCSLTTACLIGHEDYVAEAVAETDVVAVALARASFDGSMARSDAFRRFVFAAFATRVTELFRIIDDVAFGRMDVRLAGKLLELSRGGDRVAVTQQQLASELGSAREVVGRLLAEFQRRGWIKVGRGGVFLVDRPALEAFHLP